MDLVNQTEPDTSLDALFKGLQHAFGPDRWFGPCPSKGRGFFNLFSSGDAGHCRRLRFHGSVHHASTFLRPLAPRRLRRFVATMDALTPVLPRFFGADWLRSHERRSLLAGQVSLLHVPALLTIPTPTTLTAPASL